jgi:hypothetical protein
MFTVNDPEFNAEKDTRPPTWSSMECCRLVALIEPIFSCSNLFRSSAHLQKAENIPNQLFLLPIRKINGFLFPPIQDNHSLLNKILDLYPITKPFREVALNVIQKR